MAARFKHEREHEVRTYAYHFAIARRALKDAEKAPKSIKFNAITCFVFCAFTLEAYLNHLGSLRGRGWADFERSPVLAKLRWLSDQFHVEWNYEEGPIETLRQVVRFRNAMAHGRTERASHTELSDVGSPNPDDPFTGAKWQGSCTIEAARRAVDAVDCVVRALHEAAYLEEDPFEQLAQRIVSVSLAEPKDPSERSTFDDA
jgi:hypothetical protein